MSTTSSAFCTAKSDQDKTLTHTLKDVKQIFFDCDNTLVGTEDVAAEAAAIIVKKVFADQNMMDDFDNMELFDGHFGKTARQIVVNLQSVFNFTLTKEEIAAYAKEEEDLVVKLLHEYPFPCGGVKQILQQLFDMKKYKLAVVSSSPIDRIRAALKGADIEQFFDHSNVYSAKSSMPAPKSKPDPAIYEWAMEKNGVTPDECIAFEDSRSGARSALDAGIVCVAYVGAYPSEQWKEDTAKILKDEGCQVVMKHYGELDACLEEVGRELEKRD